MPLHASPTNAIQKVCAVLRALGGHAPLRLSEVTVATGLNKVTALRILDTLIEEGFAERIETGRRYKLGRESLALAAGLKRPHDLRDLARPGMIRIAGACEDTVLLSVRSGDEAVCIERQIGAFPIRANYLDIGSRRPLGVGGGSTALLAWLPDAEIEALLEQVAGKLAPYPRLSLDLIRAGIAAARERGFALFIDLVIERMGGIGLPIRDPQGGIIGAFSIAALSERIRGRERELVELMRRESDLITRELA
jgi:DNA-binding IclR family transcriptional regulator